MKRFWKLNPQSNNRPKLPEPSGICDLTHGERQKSGPQREKASCSESLSVESALLDLCREIAGTLLRGIQSRQDPARLRIAMCRDLQRHGGFPAEQSESLVALAIELIRAKSAGEYQGDSSEIGSLIEKALGERGAEGWN